MSNLLDLLTDLALDTNKQSAFLNNPSSLMDEVGLTEAEKTAMMSGENVKIAALFAEERVPFAITFVNPDPTPCQIQTLFLLLHRPTPNLTLNRMWD